MGMLDEMLDECGGCGVCSNCDALDDDKNIVLDAGSGWNHDEDYEDEDELEGDWDDADGWGV